jgi:hypothetical protein
LREKNLFLGVISNSHVVLVCSFGVIVFGLNFVSLTNKDAWANKVNKYNNFRMVLTNAKKTTY